MLSSSPSKIHEPRVTGVSPRPTTSDSARKLRNTSEPVGARNSAHLRLRDSAHRRSPRRAGCRADSVGRLQPDKPGRSLRREFGGTLATAVLGDPPGGVSAHDDQPTDV
jgi:hypothetical protein